MSTTVQKVQLSCARIRSMGAVVLAAWVAMIWMASAGQAQTVSTAQGEGGVLFASQKGGSEGAGVVYRRAADGTVTALHSFDVNSASEPAGSLVRESGGIYYGATANGTRTTTVSTGTFGLVTNYTYGPGVIFSVSPEPGSYHELRRFAQADGLRPLGSLLVLPLTSGDLSAGSLLLGVASGGGANGAGTIFSLHSHGTEFSVIHSFPVGSVPSGGLTLSGGYVYGALRQNGSSGVGSVFRFSYSNGTVGTLETIHTFTSTSLGLNTPVGGPVADASGNLWVTLEAGGAGYGGLVKVVPPTSAGGSATVTSVLTLSSVYGKPAGPPSTLKSDGMLLFTAGLGNSRGSLLRVQSTGGVTELWRFSSSPATSLYDPVGTPVELPDGSWMGSTKSGGSAGRGGVVRIEPMTPGASNATKVSGSYSLVSGTYTLAGAAADAVTRGGHLAVFATDTERTSAITSLGTRSSSFWLGGSDRGVEGQWRWITGEAFTYANATSPWSGTEPNNSGNEDGLEWSTSGLFNDLVDSQTKGYVLETEIWGRSSSYFDETATVSGYTFLRSDELISSPVLLPGNPVRVSSGSSLPTVSSTVMQGFDSVDAWYVEWTLAPASGSTLPAGHTLKFEAQGGLTISGTLLSMGSRTIGTLSAGTSVVRLTFAAGIEAAYLQQTMDSIFVQYTGRIPSAVTVTRVISNGSSAVATSTVTTVPVTENDGLTIAAVPPVSVTLAAGSWAVTPSLPLSIPLTVTDEETPVSQMTITVVSGNTAVIPTATVSYNNGWSITVPSIVPDADGTETVNLTVTAVDAHGAKTFKVVQVVIEAAPKLIALPINTDVKLGGTLSLSVTAAGKAPLTYEWYQNGTKLDGFVAATLSVANVTPDRAGRYTVKVINSVGQIETSAVTVAVVDPPVFVTRPVSVWALEGSPAVFKADAVGGGTLTYKWYRDGVEVFTGANWTNSAVSPSDTGVYELQVANSVSTARSGPVFLTVQRSRVEARGWGDNSARQITFDGSWTNLIAVAAGEKFSLGLRADGLVVVAGTIAAPPVFTARVVGIAAGGQHAVALLEDGTLKAWGSTTTAVTGIPSTTTGVAQVVAGNDFTAWIDIDGKPRIAGGEGSGITIAATASQVYRSLKAGPTVLLGRVRSSGEWVSMGGKGQALPPTASVLTGLTQVGVGLTHGLGLNAAGTSVLAWGDTTYGQTTLPTDSLPSAMTAVSAGHYHSVVLGAANQVVAWGAGSSASATAWPHFGQSIVPANLKAAQVAAGGFHTVVLAHRAPEFFTGLAAQSVQLGQSASLTVVVDGVAPITYQWSKGGTTVANQTGATLTIGSTTVADGGTYRVTVTTPYGSIYSEAVLTVIEPPTVTTTATTQTLNEGTDATLSVSPSGTGPFTYQWLLNDEPIDGAISQNYELKGLGAGQAGVYKVQVSGPGGKVTSTVTTVSVLSRPVFAVQPVSVVAISGQTASLKATVTGGGTVTLEWQKQSASGGIWTAMSGATTGTLDFSNVQSSAAGTYRLVASNAAGSVNSAEVTLTVVDPAGPGTPDITVATVLSSTATTSGTATSVDLPVVTAGVARELSGVVGKIYRFSAQYTGTEPVQLQWLRNGLDLAGAITSVLELPALDAGGSQDGLYQVRLMNAAGPGAAVTGAGVRLTTAGAPRLLVAPTKEVLGQIGGTVSLPLEVAGTVSTVVWRKNGVELSVAAGSRWSVSGSSLTITGLLSDDVGRYEATLNNSLGSLVTPEISVRLTGTPPVIGTQPLSAVKVVGAAVSLTVVASGPDGVPLSYQWFLDGKAIAGATSETYGVTSIGLKDVGDYTVLVTARGNGSVSSEPASVRLVEAPVITQQPVDVNVLVGTAVTLKVVAKGDASSAYPTTYRWYNRNGPIANTAVAESGTTAPPAPVTGQATDTLVVTHTEVPPDGVVQYYCVVENAAGKVTSKPALVVVLKALSELAVSGDTNAIQTFNLKPGWNAIYLAVEPANSAVDTVFAGIPWSSVWRFKNKRDQVQFIQDMSEAQWDSAKWLVRWPLKQTNGLANGQANPVAFDNTLSKVSRHNAYLVHIPGTNSFTLRVQGGNGHLPTRWVTDNYNLIGLPVNPTPVLAATGGSGAGVPTAPSGAPTQTAPSGPKVQDFISSYPELWDGTQSAPRGMYRLTVDGIWAPMVAGDEVKYGEAYWVYAKGAPNTSGSFGLELDYGESLDFPDDNDRRTIKLINPKATSTKVRIQLQAAGTLSLSESIAPSTDPNFGDPDKVPVTTAPTGQATLGSLGVTNVSPIEVMTPTVAGMVPINLALSGVVELAAGEERTLVLKANRSTVGARGWRNLLLLDDGISTYRVPASINRSATLLTGKSVTKRRGVGAKSATTTPTAPGLWLGRVSIGGVSPVNGYDTLKTTKSFVNDDGVATNVVEISYVAKTNMAEATPVSQPLEFSVIIHVDNQGASKILQEVYLMQAPPTIKPPATNETPGVFVLISDRRNLANFQGTAMKGRERSGRRLSSMVLGLNGAARTNGYLAMSGQFKAGNAVTVTVGMDSRSPLNPFYHKYHPDHDNLTADFKVYQEEAYGFSRDITVALNADQDGGGAKDGSEVMKGTYTEVIRGLHRLPIQVKGQVEMVRVSTLSVINPTTW